MYVIVQHQVKDPEKFFADPGGVAQRAPAGVLGRIFCPSRDRTTAVCLWEADSVSSVRDYLDPVTAGVSENAYFEVGAEHAIGLPATAAASA